ncbi:MAG: hypothetical protein QOH19_2298 [Actinomycetota bacterium]|jgi:hypothetical protein|nr:hypothetical protein [Actinomycetota bacterium]
MNEQANGQLQAPAQNQGNTGPAQPAGHAEQPRFTVDRKTWKKNEAVLGPFTIRDLTVFGSTLVLFVASLIPMFAFRYNLWNLGSLFFLGLGILLPVIVSALFVARRLSPATRIRIGSLSVDQFASVVAAFAVAFFFLAVAGAFVPTLLLALVGALGLFAATVLGRFIPYFAGDFLDREETPAHVAARDAAVPARKPRAPKAPKAAKETASKGFGSSPFAGWAKRITPGGRPAAPAEAPAAAPHDAARNAPAGAVPGLAQGPAQGQAGGASAAGAAPRGGASVVTSAPAGMAAPVAGAPATEVHGVVRDQPAEPAAASPAAARPAAAPPAAEQTQAAGVGTADAAARAAAAAEETRAAELPLAANGTAPTTVNPTVRSQAPIGATVDPANRPAEDEVQPVHEAFWFAVAQPRTAVDEHTGAPVFVIEPGGWVLALEDRGHEFLVQHTDGRVGLLRDLSNIERG